MDSNGIEQLLQKYWNCETSLEEERQLRAFFQSDNVPKHLEETAALFRYFEAQRKPSMQSEEFNNTAIPKLTVSRTRNLLYNSLRIAAGIAVLVAAVWFVRKEPQTPTAAVVVDTYNDPKLAFEETKKALLMISNSFEKAEEQAKKINLFNEAQKQIEPPKR